MSPQWKLGLGLLVFASLIIGWIALTRRTPANLGLQSGRLRPCPSSPNCVCSEAVDPLHAIPPLAFEGDAGAAWQRLIALLERTPRAAIVTRTENYLHAAFTTPLRLYVDDVEFRLDPDGRQIQFRSASRIGHSDLGVNRQRMEQLRQEFTTALQ